MDGTLKRHFVIFTFRLLLGFQDNSGTVARKFISVCRCCAVENERERERDRERERQTDRQTDRQTESAL